MPEEPDTSEQQDEEAPRRRAFFQVIFGSAIALLGGAAAYVAAGFMYPVRKAKPPALFVCLASEVPPGSVREVADLKGRKVLLMRAPDGPFVAIGTVCSHLGCTVFYRPKKGVFECPCHQGVFDAQGNPIAGPPERPLDRYPTEVRGGKVFIQFA
ncbi:MAG: Rieske (2Fe-2S) protein [Armatimonadota bacterium]